MPKILRAGGLVFSDDVVKIRDMAPSGARPVKRPPPADGEDVAVAIGALPAEEADFQAETFTDAEAALPPPPANHAMGAAVREEIVQSAMAEAGRILEDAVRKGEEQKAQVLEQAQAQAQGELNELRQQAVLAGRAEARDAVMSEVQQAAGKLEEVVARFEGERAGFETEYENQLRWLAIEIASKVLAKKVAADDAEMAEMVDKAVQSVRDEPWIRVEVSQEMTALIDRLTSLYDQQANIEVSAVPAEPGTIHIETPGSVVDASLRTQLENLRGYFSQARG